MTESRFVGLPLDEALLLCASQGISPDVIETRSPRGCSGEKRAARVVAVRGGEAEPVFVVAFFSADGPKESEHASKE